MISSSLQPFHPYRSSKDDHHLQDSGPGISRDGYRKKHGEQVAFFFERS